MNRVACLFASALLLACGEPRPSATAPATTEGAETPRRADDARGGRLFDSWRAELGIEDFVPDTKGTPGVADGQGGPHGDGTLALGTGEPLLNDGHDYRLKNLFGWDLRGAEGIYGPSHMNKGFVRARSLLSWSGDAATIAARLAEGDDETPAFGAVLPADALDDLAAFVVGVRDGALPHPDAIFSLAAPDAGLYALRDGGDAERGHAVYAARCASCHGADGTAFLFDDGAFALGPHARQKAYEDWLKILNGQPGSSMGRMIEGESGPALAQTILDLLAALCDRERYPSGAGTAADVADGDPRCGVYLR
ncbi:MAG: hypothetical protein KF901_05340 [Myxococcales bacterium]|nr:hypothetical protein [Myxococcales bacterium]